MEKGSHIILKNYSADLKFLNNSVGIVTDLSYENGKLSKIKMIFNKPVYQLKPIKAEILIWVADVSHVIQLCRTPIKVGRTPVEIKRLPIIEEINNEEN